MLIFFSIATYGPAPISYVVESSFCCSTRQKSNVVVLESGCQNSKILPYVVDAFEPIDGDKKSKNPND